MAISIITWAGNAASGSASSRAVADDAATQAQDVRYVAFSISNETITTPSGWALVGGAPLVIASTRRIYVFRRVHQGGSEPASTTFTFTGAANHSMVTWAARGADPTTPDDVVLSAASGTSGSALAAPDRTTVTAGAVLVSLHYLIANGSSITLSLPSGMTSIATGAGTGSAGHAYRVAHETRPTAGATGTRTSTASTSGAWGAAAFAIRPLTSQTITPDSIGSGEAFGTPDVAAVLQPDGIPTGEVVGAPALDHVQSVVATGIPSAEAFGTPTLVYDQTVTPASITTGEVVPTPGLVYDQTIRFDALLYPGAGVEPGPGTFPGAVDGDGIPSAEAVGQPTLTVLVDITLIPRSTARRRTLHELWCVARIPQENGPPTLLPVDPIDWSSLSWTEELSRPETLDATVKISSLPESIRERIRHPAHLPSELWLYRDGELVVAGPWVTSTPTGSDLRMTGWGLLGYLWYRIISHAPFVQVDQALIVKSLIDSTQARPWGHFGLDTSGITPTEVLRDITYRLLDRNILGQRVQELGRRQNGFDIDVDPATRQVQLHYPGKGVDRSVGDGAIVFDARNITDPTASISTLPGDIASLVTAVGTSDRDPVYGFAGDSELASKWGLADHLEIFDGVSEQSTIDAHAAAAQDTRRGPLVIPGPDIRIDDDTDLSRWSVGDTVEHQVHAELGIRGTFRVRKRTVTVAADGTETCTPEFG